MLGRSQHNVPEDTVRPTGLTSPCSFCAVRFKDTQHAAACAMILHAKLVLHHPEVFSDGSGASALADGGTTGRGLHGPTAGCSSAPPPTESRSPSELGGYTRDGGKGLEQGKGNPAPTQGPGLRSAPSTAQRQQQQPQKSQTSQFQPQLPPSRQSNGQRSGRSASEHHSGLAQARVAEQWQAETPETIRQPLRTVLLQTWASELKTRVEALATDPAKHQEAVRLQALTEPDTFRYKTWNPTLRALENVTNLAPLTTREVISLLEELVVLSTEESALINHRPTKKLLPEMTGPTVTFSLVLGLRDPKAYRLWSVIESLSGSAALMLVATTLRKECRSRSQL